MTPSANTAPLSRNSRWAAAVHRISLWCGVVVNSVAVIVLIGWTWQQPFLTGLFGSITMKTNAAIALLLGGTALLLRQRVPLVTAILGACVTCLGGVTLIEHLSGFDFGIDQALFTEAAGALATASPNRMGPNAAMSFVLAGAALVLMTRPGRGAVRLAQVFGFGGMALATLALTGFIYGATQLYAVANITGIAWHTAAALLLLHVGILCARSDQGPMAQLVSDGPEGTMLRRQVLPVTMVPFLVGYLVLLGRNANLYDRGVSLSLLVISLVALLWITMWHTAFVLEQSDERRRRAEHGVDMLLIRERQARDDAERANRLKDQFIATLSHELRTPLNVMLGWTQVLESGARANQHAHAAAVVARNGRLLARLIEDLLDISRAAAGQFEVARRPVTLNAIAQTALDAIAPLADSKGLLLTRALDPDLPVIEADADRLQQVVWNLLSNAVKFTPRGGHIDLRTEAAPNGTVRMQITDSGIGFDESFARHVFEPFRQADASMRREHGGLGLGLSIAKHLVQLHGGTITGTSPGRGHGATFTVTLPAITASEAAQDTPLLHAPV